MAYIYLDGETFIELNLTAPYWGTVSAVEPVPPIKQSPEGKGDLVDWSIFLLILTGTLFGFFVMVHQMGLVIDPRLRFRHVFHPTLDAADWGSDDALDFAKGQAQPRRGGGFSHAELSMTVESIPTSMGGGRGSPPTRFRDAPNGAGAGDAARGDLDLEMAERRPPARPDASGSLPPMSGNAAPGSFRDPDSVERPSLKSRSKIALPKTSPVIDDGSPARTLQFKENGGPPIPPLGR